MNDTAYFDGLENKKYRLYYHFELDNVEGEFRINYTRGQVKKIKDFFGLRQIFMFDLSYSPEALLTAIFSGFKNYLLEKNKGLLPTILISHPFNGIKNLEKDY